MDIIANRKPLFKFGEVVRLKTGEFATALGNLFEDDIFADHESCVVLLFPPFRDGIHDNGLRELSPACLDKQYANI